MMTIQLCTADDIRALQQQQSKRADFMPLQRLDNLSANDGDQPQMPNEISEPSTIRNCMISAFA